MVCPAMVSDPRRVPPELEVTRNFTVPLPSPVSPEITLIQDVLETAVHAQPLAAVTATVSSLASFLSSNPAGSTTNVHEPACEIVAVCPAIVRVPARGAPVLAAAVKVTDPVPERLDAGEVMVSQFAVVAADHVQPGAVVSSIGVPAPPEIPIDCDAGAIEKAHPLAWLIPNAVPETLMAALRAGPGLAATENRMVPLPVPLCPDVTVIQLALGTAVHSHSALVLTATAGPAPAASDTEVDSGVRPIVHPPPCDTVTICPATVSVPVRAPPLFALMP